MTRTTKATAPTCEWCQLPEVPKRCVREADMCADVRTRARLAEAALAEARGLLEQTRSLLERVHNSEHPLAGRVICWLTAHPVAPESE